MPSEEWRDIGGYVGLYQVSNLGNVRNRHGRILSPSTYKGNITTVHTATNGRMRNNKEVTNYA